MGVAALINTRRSDIFSRLSATRLTTHSPDRMPTYEYRCRECGTDFEKFQRMSDEPVAECPKCGAQAERRLSAGAGLLFKGSGFYITDYRGDSYKKAAEGDKSGGSSGSGGSGSGGESKGGSESKSTSPPSSSGTKSE
jgi:putative FmdB family regulatory protein